MTAYSRRTALSANTNTLIASAGARDLRVHVNVLNQNAVPALAHLFVGQSLSPADGDYLEWAADLLPDPPLVRGPLALPAGFSLYAKTNLGNCSAIVTGEEWWLNNTYLTRTVLTPDTDAIIATAPAGPAQELRVSVQVLNKVLLPRAIRFAHDTDGIPALENYIEKDGILLPKIPIIRGPIVLKPGEKLVARASGDGCNAIVMGDIQLLGEFEVNE